MSSSQRQFRSCEPHGFNRRLCKRVLRVGEPEHNVEMAGTGHWYEANRATARHHRGHVNFALPFKLVGFIRRVGDDEWHSELRQVQQRGECCGIAGTKLQPFIRMAEPNRLKIIEPAQERGAAYEIVWHAESSLPTRAQHHSREMRSSGAAAHMDTHGIAAKNTRMRVDPGDRRAALVHYFREGHMRG